MFWKGDLTLTLDSDLEQSSYLNLRHAGMTGMSHHTQLSIGILSG